MKVCADSLLFGALIPLPGTASRALDIGTGTGILSLMLAQRSGHKLHIDAVELMPESAAEANENFLSSPWASRLQCYAQDIQTFADQQASDPYQLIFSNPPFFHNHSKTILTSRASELRFAARHTDSLSYEDLCRSATSMLAEQGIFSVLIPQGAFETFLVCANQAGLICQDIIEIKDSEDHATKVLVVNFQKSKQVSTVPATRRSIIRFQGENKHSPQVKALLADFLLRYAS